MYYTELGIGDEPETIDVLIVWVVEELRIHDCFYLGGGCHLVPLCVVKSQSVTQP